MTDRSRNGTPINGIAIPSLSAGETWATRRVSRSWKIVTIAGFTITSTPQSSGGSPCTVVSETGSTTSNAT